MLYTPENQVNVTPDSRGVACDILVGKRHCRKLIANTLGTVICRNGHNIPIIDLLTAFAINPASDTMSVLKQLTKSPFPMLKGLYARVLNGELHKCFYASGAKDNLYRLGFPCSDPQLFCELVAGADLHEPTLAAQLRSDLRASIKSHYPLLGEYLDLLSGLEGDLFLERCLMVWSRSHYKDPLHYQVMTPLYLEAARACQSPQLPFYEHNMQEALRATTDREFMPVYYKESAGQHNWSFIVVVNARHLAMPNPAVLNLFVMPNTSLEEEELVPWVSFYPSLSSDREYNDNLKKQFLETASLYSSFSKGDEWSDHPFNLLCKGLDWKAGAEPPVKNPNLTPYEEALCLAKAFRDIAVLLRYSALKDMMGLP